MLDADSRSCLFFFFNHSHELDLCQRMQSLASVEFRWQPVVNYLITLKKCALLRVHMICIWKYSNTFQHVERIMHPANVQYRHCFDRAQSKALKVSLKYPEMYSGAVELTFSFAPFP